MQLELFNPKDIDDTKEEEGYIKGPRRSRILTYLVPGRPRLIIEGKWLTKNYGLRVGDKVRLEYLEDRIIIHMK